MESHIIKRQHNYSSEYNPYADNNFIPIIHEHLLVFKKSEVGLYPLKEQLLKPLICFSLKILPGAI